MSSRRPPETRVGARTAGEIEAAVTRLTTGPAAGSETVRGALAAYTWVAGHHRIAPVSGATGPEDPPDDAELDGEERAAMRRAHDKTAPGDARDFSSGVAQALAWVLGHIDHQP
ncbi:hypothetical protein OG871_35780 [Kitasatospora sp. NBC_00374]|uniref:hypothetical protein n=1 Tax=Kitasatospora sp. NBC_00374 TaxID=2975964 RepID=UPI00324F5817